MKSDLNKAKELKDKYINHILFLKREYGVATKTKPVKYPASITISYQMEAELLKNKIEMLKEGLKSDIECFGPAWDDMQRIINYQEILSILSEILGDEE